MRKSSPRYAEYIKRQNRTRERKRFKKNKKCKKLYNPYAAPSKYTPVLENTFKGNDDRKTYTSQIPKCFSIINNPNEVAEYFSTLIAFLKHNKDVRCLNFNFSEVKEITVDALMYLMSVIKFIRRAFCKVEQFSGNIPTEPSVKDLFIKSGFPQLMTSSRIKFAPDENVIRICYDNSTNTQKTKEICEFVIAHSQYERTDTMFLYNMLMELEVNAAEHAYNDEETSIFQNKWLAFVEDAGSTFRFTFLDIGVGIFRTLYRKLHEKVFKQPDYHYVISAFEGAELRSETRRRYRGRGLPKVKEFFDNGRIKNLKVITNRAYCYGNYGYVPSFCGEQLL